MNSYSDTRTKGRMGEELALEYLQNKGFTFIEKNYTRKGGEIDLIMRDNDMIVFVEVKSLNEDSDYSIYSSITSAKKKFLKHIINKWLLAKGHITDSWRVDFIGIVYKDDGTNNLEHFEFIDILSRGRFR